MPNVLSLAMLVILPAPDIRPLHEIRAELRATMKADSNAESAVERSRTLIQLTRLYQELTRDPRLGQSPTLLKFKSRLWARLTKSRDEIQRQISYRRKQQDQGRPSSSSSPSARGGGAVLPDHGPSFVALIERTISPDFWDVHGGPGTIVYYRPLRVLVVRATDDVHGSVRCVIAGLR